jgi:hypothetical protein
MIPKISITLDAETDKALQLLQARLGLASRSAAIRCAAKLAERATRLVGAETVINTTGEVSQ